MGDFIAMGLGHFGNRTIKVLSGAMNQKEEEGRERVTN